MLGTPAFWHYGILSHFDRSENALKSPLWRHTLCFRRFISHAKNVLSPVLTKFYVLCSESVISCAQKVLYLVLRKFYLLCSKSFISCAQRWKWAELVENVSWQQRCPTHHPCFRGRNGSLRTKWHHDFVTFVKNSHPYKDWPSVCPKRG